jgi:hypothetical protein
MWTKFKTLMPPCVLAVILILSLGQTSCGTVPQPPPASSVASLTLYQPLTLQLAAGVPIKSKAGIYTPQVDEIWYSPQEYAKVVNQLYNNINAADQKSLNK